MSAKTRLQHSILQVLKRDKSGSYATQYDRRGALLHFAEELIALGYKLPAIENIKQKHIEAVVEHWKQAGLKNSTLKNRLSMIRRLASLINKPNIVPTNQALDIGKRQYISRVNRAIHNPDFSAITDPYIKVSLELQRVFGLRREESLKIKPHLADKGDILDLLPSWCKGGRGRRVPIQTQEQRYWLEEAKRLVGKFGLSLIPRDKTYIQHRNTYDDQVSLSKGKIKNPHGLRHAYAQRRYKELTGWETTKNGGPAFTELTKEQQELDHRARMILTEELGHGRKSVVKIYA